ncbi:HIT domain-containing protein [Schleiferiaceae bacterium]|jgi:histidine triad (HIT) family protein|nr:HIT family protein [Flavobacteriales bacterium]MDC1022232.1 HIT domain-containing protein [Schleiferiaceae bacterium]|tara:strand:+ start:2414 stop:2818 length:405 start_codon:yes stop_codon:yes gene_type:complete
MSSIFTKIINGEIPCYKVAEDDMNIAFLDIHPIKTGHILCVPKLEVDELFELPMDDFNSLMSFTQRVAQSLKRMVPCKRIGSLVLGMEVPHAHIHLVPINAEHELSFAHAKVALSNEEMLALAQSISDDLDSVQ